MGALVALLMSLMGGLIANAEHLTVLQRCTLLVGQMETRTAIVIATLSG